MGRNWQCLGCGGLRAERSDADADADAETEAEADAEADADADAEADGQLTLAGSWNADN